MMNRVFLKGRNLLSTSEHYLNHLRTTQKTQERLKRMYPDSS
uniref:Uncharacterized protein n=1 Tax=Arundo donax TaxID=35708 RepID=A0A0A8ZHC3_ARUDO